MRLPLKWFAPTVLGLAVLATVSWAATQLTPGSLLANPEAYQSQVVRVRGLVANHKIRRLRARKCVQSFTMKDETSAIVAVY